MRTAAVPLVTLLLLGGSSCREARAQPTDPPPRLAPRIADVPETASALLERLRGSRPDAPAIVPRSTWDPERSARAGMHAYPGDLHEAFNHIVVHHTDFVDAPGPETILRYHRESSGFADIGYHFVVSSDGRIYEGRDLRYMGAHAGVSDAQRGDAKADPDFGAIGVVLDGNFELSRPSETQVAAAFALLDDLRARFGVPRANVLGHRQAHDELIRARGHEPLSPPTTCPGDQLFDLVGAYARLDDAG